MASKKVKKVNDVKPIDTKPLEVIPEVKPKTFSPLVVILILLLTITTVSAGYFYSQIPKKEENSNAQKPSITEEVSPTEAPSDTVSPTNTPTVSATPVEVISKATIKGSLSYPSDFLPPMSVCAVSIITDVETCIETELNQSSFKIDVNPGTYIIYSSMQFDDSDKESKAYYTKCDTLDDSFVPECNENAGAPEDNGKWNKVDFICYEDDICKAAFTPLKISVLANEVKQLKTIIQGWYIPCSHDEATCNDIDFDVWSDYLE